MRSKKTYYICIVALAAVMLCAAVAGQAGRREFWLTPPKAEGETSYMVPPPPFTEGIFPCSECHKEMVPNPKRRALKDEHTNIELKNHAENERWCLDCHDTRNRDKLRLVSGELIDFTESYRLCGQCHGDKYRDWRVGVHGKRTGLWNGKKEYLLCAHCHNPHNPRFKPLQPKPPPLRPEYIK
jgi:hypothetical protein